MRFVRYSVVLLLVLGLFAAPIWPITVETRGHTRERRADGVSIITGSYSYRTTYLVPFSYSQFGWITSMPPGWLILRSPIQPDQRSG